MEDDGEALEPYFFSRHSLSEKYNCGREELKQPSSEDKTDDSIEMDKGVPLDPSKMKDSKLGKNLGGSGSRPRSHQKTNRSQSPVQQYEQYKLI